MGGGAEGVKSNVEMPETIHLMDHVSGEVLRMEKKDVGISLVSPVIPAVQGIVERLVSVEKFKNEFVKHDLLVYMEDFNQFFKNLDFSKKTVGKYEGGMYLIVDTDIKEKKGNAVLCESRPSSKRVVWGGLELDSMGQSSELIPRVSIYIYPPGIYSVKTWELSQSRGKYKISSFVDLSESMLGQNLPD